MIKKATENKHLP